MSEIIIIGAGYVGLAHACLFQDKFNVTLVDNDLNKINNFKKGISPIKEMSEIISKTTRMNYITKLEITNSTKAIFIALPTNSKDNQLDTSIIEKVLKTIPLGNIPIVIKSTVPVGFSESLNREDILFSPEFLREGKALYDLKHPSRLVIGSDNIKLVNKVIDLYKQAITDPFPILQMTLKEAETVKLFANTYLAMRVAFFNELDTYTLREDLDTSKLIQALSYDNRIGRGYNNTSFGYGGYCLPKDTKQTATLVKTPLIQSIEQSNQYRKEVITQDLLDKDIKTIGVYSFSMKKDSDNDRESALFDIITKLKQLKPSLEILIFNNDSYPQFKNITNLDLFIEQSNLIVVNRIPKELEKVKEKLYTRDLFKTDD